MTTPPTIPASADGDNPIDTFSKCHSAILARLDELGRLPALLEPAAQARRIAAETVGFFREAVYGHHAEEERDLFPAVRAAAAPGDERDKTQAMIDRLVREHRQVEDAWKELEPALNAVAKGHETTLDAEAVGALVERYRAHAAFEEEYFLPLSQNILGRNGSRLAALGLSMHLRHALPEVLRRYGRPI